MKPEVNVIMVARGLWPMTLKALEGLIFTADVPWRLSFFSNGSEDETIESFRKVADTWAWQYFCGHEFQYRSKPVSLAVAWNMAYEKVEPTKYTMFVNNDIVFHKAGWMSRLTGEADRLDLVGIQEMSWYQFRFVEGSLLTTRTSVLEIMKEDGKVFDTRFKLSCEDVDLSRRYLQAGLRIGQVAGLQPEYLVHIGHQTLTYYGPTEDLVGKMHDSRKALCKKWDIPPKVED